MQEKLKVVCKWLHSDLYVLLPLLLPLALFGVIAEVPNFIDPYSRKESGFFFSLQRFFLLPSPLEPSGALAVAHLLPALLAATSLSRRLHPHRRRRRSSPFQSPSGFPTDLRKRETPTSFLLTSPPPPTGHRRRLLPHRHWRRPSPLISPFLRISEKDNEMKRKRSEKEKKLIIYVRKSLSFNFSPSCLRFR